MQMIDDKKKMQKFTTSRPASDGFAIFCNILQESLCFR